MHKSFKKKCIILILMSVVIHFVCGNCRAGNENEQFDIKVWIGEAETLARAITDEADRIDAMWNMAAVYSDLEKFQEAKELAQDFPQREQNILWSIISLAQIRAKDIEGALKTIEVIENKEEYYNILKYIGRYCVNYSINQAVKIAEDLPPDLRSPIYRRIVEQYILNEDLKKANDAFNKISDNNDKNEALCWMQAWEIYKQKDLRIAAEEKGLKLDELSPYLRSIARAKIEKGDARQAQKIIVQLPLAGDRAKGYISLAKYYLNNNQKKEYKKALQMALDEAKRINDPVTKDLARAGAYLAIASLQVKAGELKGAEKTIQFVQKSSEQEAKNWQRCGMDEGFFQTMGGSEAIYSLMILIGKKDEVLHVAEHEKYPLSKYARSALAVHYASEGEMNELRELVRSSRTNKDKFNIYLAVINSFTRR